jgi:2-polyprenyl-3-methyl-5-hydroxy-6-metoxy-1,4-benzoquinol methylase
VWGLDINASLIEHIKEKYGWENLVAHDATAQPLARDYFDVIHAGDVIEHVSNIGGFMEFCRDSLKPGGRLIVSTPNPHAFEFVKRARYYGMVPANAEHVCWITAPSMNELCRRYGMEFEKSYFLCGKKKVRQLKIFGKSLLFKYRDLIWYDSLWVIKKPL